MVSEMNKKKQDAQQSQKEDDFFSLLFLKEDTVCDCLAIIQPSFLPLNPEARRWEGRGFVTDGRAIPGHGGRKTWAAGLGEQRTHPFLFLKSWERVLVNMEQGKK